MRAPRTRRRRTLPALLALAALATTAAVTAVVPLTTPPAHAADPVVVREATFEDGTTQGFRARGGETVAVSTATAHGGTHSLLVSGRTASWQGPAVDLLDEMTKGTRYTLSVRVRLAAGQSPGQARLSVQRDADGSSAYDQVVGDTAVTADAWTQLTGTYVLAHDVDGLSAYVETASGTADLHIDDFVLSYRPTPPVQTDIPALREVLADDFPIGAAVGNRQLVGDQATLLTRHFDTVTPGNALKWDATQPTEGSFRWTDADTQVGFAVDHGLAVRGHTLVWHQQTPAWVFTDTDGTPLTADPADKALLLDRLETHVRTVVSRYGDRIGVWDVANEVIDENQADGLRRSRWYEISGLDYLRTAFRVAREVAPTAKLYLNDYNTNVPAKRDKLRNLVGQLRAEGVPVDGVGHQMHVNVQWPSVAETEAMLQAFVPLGVEQQITEMDVSIYTNEAESFPTPPADRLRTQAYRYRDLFDLYRRYADELTSVTLWGLADDDTWLDTFPVARKDAPLLFDTELQAKPAYWGIVDPTRIDATPSPSPTVTPSVTPSQTGSPYPTGNTPSSTPTSGLDTCRVTYTVTNQWPGGFQATVRITNTGVQAHPGWSLRWFFRDGQRVAQLWNGSVRQDGDMVTVTPASWNANLPAGGTVEVGFLGSWSSANNPPIGFTLDRLPCVVG
ncbi:endo-1,4-beta-xylanase [Micromonospora cathayae]|uniref:Beta-xylanase n=1 Tax=Micromonospora cathayae TaxID=3028804 RepID=A0ABY7ZXB2_9ACTN|nr:endo-1,4-beta-xylanase [Micromonospora sp. HUAS 3]WDZ87709.1 endo-1,4-beta-xylanase [Micromonospora sp. HUAS 3]